MNVYEPILNENTNFYNAKNPFQFMKLSENEYPEDKKFDFYYEKQDDFIDADFTWISSNVSIAFKNKFTDLLKELNIGEIIKIDESYSIIQPQILDALSFFGTKYNRSSIDNQIVSIEKYSFKEKIIKNEYMFRLKTLQCSPIYVTQKFVDFYNENKFSGLYFKIC